MPRSKKTEQEIKTMRGRILDAALALLQQDGLDGVSIRKIADRIGVSHMLLYSYFDNRAAITRSLRERGFEQMEAFCAESLRRAETGDALVQVRESLGLFIQMSHEYPMLYQLAWRRSSDNPSLRVDSRNMARILEYLSQLIHWCIERGQCIERDPTLAAVMVFSIINGTLMLYHNMSAIGQTAQAKLETEMIEAAMTYLTK
ncbi:TetR/AcrR family transcriptional regulator [Chloroflexota bacterium]